MSIVMNVIYRRAVVLSHAVVGTIAGGSSIRLLRSGRKEVICIVMLDVQPAIEDEETEKLPVAQQRHPVTPPRLIPAPESEQ